MPNYVVNGPFGFRGNPPGAEFTASPDEVIGRALKRGSIAKAPTAPSPAPAKPATADHKNPKEEK